MKYNTWIILLIIASSLVLQCDDEPTPIYGCMDPTAYNYNPLANLPSGNCLYSGCMDPDALNYDPTAFFPDTCYYDPQVTFYTTATSGGLVTLNIDGQYFGSCIFAGFNAPECGSQASAYATFQIPQASYQYTAQNGVKQWTGSFTLSYPNQCVLIQLP